MKNTALQKFPLWLTEFEKLFRKLPKFYGKTSGWNTMYIFHNFPVSLNPIYLILLLNRWSPLKFFRQPISAQNRFCLLFGI